MKPMERENGFTFVELLIVMFLMTVITGAFYSVYRVQTRSMKSQENRLVAQQDARSALDFMVREIRNTGYNPEEATSGDNCGASGIPGIIDATEKIFHFSYDADSDGHCTGAGENIKYEYDDTSDDVTRAVGGAAQNLTDGNATSFDLRYFKQDGTEIARPVAAADLPNIKRILISLTVRSKNPDTEFGGGQLIATMTSNVDLRNRGSL